MTENEIKEFISDTRRKSEIFRNSGFATTGVATVFDKSADIIEELLPYTAIGTVEGYKRAIEVSKENYYLYLEYKAKVQAFEAIGTIEEFKALKEKNTPQELAEHNFQDEVHHYLCPSCRSIVSCNQNYCEECGQALET